MPSEFTPTEIVVAGLCALAAIVLCARAVYVRKKSESLANPHSRHLTCPNCGSRRIRSAPEEERFEAANTVIGQAFRCLVCHQKFRSEARRSSRRTASRRDG